MADQDAPSFEDLEPEGEDLDSLDGLMWDGIDDKDLEAFFEEALDEDEMGDLEADEYELEGLEEDEYPEDTRYYSRRQSKPSSTSLAGRAGRTALKWSRQATTSSLRGASRKQPRASRSPLGDAYPVVQSGAGVDRAVCSAALLEDRELMDVLAAAAAAASRSAEAAELVAAMVPLAIRLAPQVYRGLWPALPALIRGAVGVTRLLHSQPGSRSLIKRMPTILRGTVAQLAPQFERQPLSQGLVARALAKQTERALHRQRRTATPPQRRARRSSRLDARQDRWDDGYDD